MKEEHQFIWKLIRKHFLEAIGRKLPDEVIKASVYLDQNRDRLMTEVVELADGETQDPLNEWTDRVTIELLTHLGCIPVTP